jgi:hypothetical protein
MNIAMLVLARPEYYRNREEWRWTVTHEIRIIIATISTTVRFNNYSPYNCN